MMNVFFKKQQGVGLIEVMVTVLILATSLLAMGALQSRSLQFNHSAYLRSQANIMAYDILDRMRINRGDSTNPNFQDYERDFEDAIPTGSDLAGQDLQEWLTAVAGTLPGGEGAIECDAIGVCTVSLRWTEMSDVAGAEFDPSDPETETFSYTTRI